jgi:hypothetical protein
VHPLDRALVWQWVSFAIELSTTDPIPQNFNIRQEKKIHPEKIDIMRQDMRLSAYFIGFIYSVINGSKRSVRLKKEFQPLGFLSIPYIRSVSEKFTHSGGLVY